MERSLGVFLLLLTAPLAAQDTLTTEQQALKHYTQCYAEVMQLSPTWKIAVAYGSLGLSGEHYGASTSARPEYFQGEITYDFRPESRASDTDLRIMVVHELVHLWLHDLWEIAERTSSREAERAMERTTTLISRWPLWQTFCKETSQ